ncbi:MAG: hypothetical protein FWF30_04160, partial [Coriobacteriia bacterium]|nr:hypothetical protein [Coriobacteriia bacterium]
MCFRPTDATRAVVCPECQTFNKPGAKVCEKCGHDLTKVSNAPGAPKAPAAPGAPSAPKAPGAPSA